MIQLEIQKDEDKAKVAAILIMNGYTVRKRKSADKNGRSKYVLEAWKDKEGEKNERDSL